MFKLHLWDHLGGARVWGEGPGLWFRDHKARVSREDRTGTGFKHRPGLRKAQAGAMVKGDFPIDTRKQWTFCRYSVVDRDA